MHFSQTAACLSLPAVPGVWTGHLLRYASEVTAVDASPEMLTIAAARVGNERVRLIEADLFTWKPDRCAPDGWCSAAPSICCAAGGSRRGYDIRVPRQAVHSPTGRD
jgi:SAM-dependent methyltransferase